MTNAERNNDPVYRKVAKKGCEYDAFRDFVNRAPHPKKIVQVNSDYARAYRAIAAAYEIAVFRRDASENERGSERVRRFSLIWKDLLLLCAVAVPTAVAESKAVAVAQPTTKAAPASGSKRKEPAKPSLGRGSSKHGQVGHKERIVGSFGSEPGWAEVVASRYEGMRPDLRFTPDKKRSRLKPEETVDLFNALEWRIAAAPEFGGTPGWYIEYWGGVAFGSGSKKYADILERILDFETCEDGYHPSIRAAWAECTAGILARLRGEPCSDTSEAWQAGYRAQVGALSVEQWDASEGCFVEEEAAS